MTVQFLKQSNGLNIAYHQYTGTNPKLPGVVFCGGFMSDMEGSKATFLENLCKSREQSYVRFDYTGHGQSDGAFTDGTIGSWKKDALTVLEHLTTGPQILVGSSMGGWISLLIAQMRPENITGLVGIAAAPDFTAERLGFLTKEQEQEINENGIVYIPSDYDEPYPVTKALLSDGDDHLLLNTPINITCPVRLLQGKMDKPVPWEKANRIKDLLVSDNVEITFIDDGDHSLSRPQDLEILKKKIDELTILHEAKGLASSLDAMIIG